MNELLNGSDSRFRTVAAVPTLQGTWNIQRALELLRSNRDPECLQASRTASKAFGACPDFVDACARVLLTDDKSHIALKLRLNIVPFFEAAGVLEALRLRGACIRAGSQPPDPRVRCYTSRHRRRGRRMPILGMNLIEHVDDSQPRRSAHDHLALGELHHNLDSTAEEFAGCFRLFGTRTDVESEAVAAYRANPCDPLAVPAGQVTTIDAATGIVAVSREWASSRKCLPPKQQTA